MVTALLALAAMIQDGGMPQKEGTRWIFRCEGVDALTLEIVAGRKIDSVETKAVRVRGGPFFWTSHDLLFAVKDGALFEHASTYGEEVFPRKPALKLLSAELKTGLTWEGRSEEFAFRAAVIRRETVAVPAGKFDAWVVEYVLLEHLGTEDDLRMWFAPGTGFVKIEKWRRSTRGEKSERKAPVVYELAKFEAARPPATIPAPRLTADQLKLAQGQVARQADDEMQAREKAADALFSLGRGVIPFLQERIERGECEAEVIARMRDIVARFKPIEVVARLTRERIAVGQGLPVEFRIRNISETWVFVLPSLEKSDLGKRFPKYAIEIKDAEGRLQQADPGMR